MPKLGKDFNATLNFSVPLELKQGLTAMGYLTQGGKGEYASPSRNLLKKGHAAWLSSLSPEERKEYDQILANVKISVTR